jgi:hypothetical protein
MKIIFKVSFIFSLIIIACFDLFLPASGFLNSKEEVVVKDLNSQRIENLNNSSLNLVKRIAKIRLRKGPQVPNPSRLDSSLPRIRIFSPSAKHDKIRGFGSKMDLGNSEAQSALNSGIPVGKNVYSYFKNKFYIFRSESILKDQAVFHGYPVSKNQVPAIILKKLIKIRRE